MKKLVKIYARPKLNSPVMLATWPGIGNVSTIAATYLAKKLAFKRLGEIESSYFFDPIGIVVRDHVVEAPQFPQNRFYYWKNKEGRSDLILFIGEDQPASKGYELANCVLDVGTRFLAKRVYTLAAALTRIHHTEQPKVWGVGTNQKLTEDLKKYDLVQKGNLQIAGLNGLMLGEEYALSMGVRIQRTRLVIFATTSIMAGTITAFCGPIGFIGIAVPHMARFLLNRSDHRVLMPASMLTGMVVMVFNDIVSRLPGTEQILPINAVTSLIGIPVVIWLVVMNRKAQSL